MDQSELWAHVVDVTSVGPSVKVTQSAGRSLPITTAPVTWCGPIHPVGFLNFAPESSYGTAAKGRERRRRIRLKRPSAREQQPSLEQQAS
jgi:hypothetical protein